MNREEQVLELDRSTEEKVKLDSETENSGRNKGSKACQKYKTVFNCSYTEEPE
jgi:hypothetical protein